MSTTETTPGTWVKPKGMPTLALYASEGPGLIRYEVTVKDAQLPIPVIAKDLRQVKAVLAAHGLEFVKAARGGEVLSLNPELTPVPAADAIATFKASPTEKAATKKAKQTIAEGADDGIDSLLDAAAPATAKVDPMDDPKTATGERPSEAAMRMASEQRKAKPDPKPATKKGRASKPTTSAEKAAARKAGSKAGQKAATAEKPARAAQAKPKAATPNARSERAKKDAAEAARLYQDKTFAPEATEPAARRKAIAEKLPQLRGRVRGILITAGIDQPTGRS